MKKTQIVATLAFAFMLGISVPLTHLFNTNSVYAAEPDTESSTSLSANTSSNESTISASTREEIQTAAADTAITRIVLSSDINLSGSININRPITASTLTLDLNNHNITRASDKGYAISLAQGNLIITGSGKISGRNGIKVTGYDTNIADYANLTIDSQVVVEGRSVYAIAIISPTEQITDTYGVKVNVKGTLQGAHGISVDGGITNTANAPVVTISDGAKINVNGADGSAPVYASGYATWNIGAATLSGDTGINIRSGLLNFTNTDITATGEMNDPSTGAGGIDSTGVVFQIEHHTSYADQVAIDINGGTYTSTYGDVFYEYGNLTPATRTVGTTDVADINISGGTFTAGSGREIFGGALEDGQANIEISGGTFKGTDVANFKANGYLVGNLVVNADGTVYRPSGNHSTSDVEAPEDPSDPEAPSDPTLTPEGPQDENKVPDTGLVSDRGIISAISTVAPLLTAAGFAFMFFSGKIHERERQRRLAALESEMNAEVEQIIDESEPEPVLDRFIAVPIDRDEPTITPVDPFISRK